MPTHFADEQDVRDSATGRDGSKTLELSSNSPSSSAEHTCAFWYSLLSSQTPEWYLGDLVSTMMVCFQFFSLLLYGVLCSNTQISTVETTKNARSYAEAAHLNWDSSFKGFEPVKGPTNFTCRQHGELHLILTFAVCVSALVFSTVIDIGAAVHSTGGLHFHLMHLLYNL